MDSLWKRYKCSTQFTADEYSSLRTNTATPYSQFTLSSQLNNFAFPQPTMSASSRYQILYSRETGSKGETNVSELGKAIMFDKVPLNAWKTAITRALDNDKDMSRATELAKEVTTAVKSTKWGSNSKQIPSISVSDTGSSGNEKSGQWARFDLVITPKTK